jgi:hypothetical protein
MDIDKVLRFLIDNNVASVSINYNKQDIVITERFGSSTTWDWSLVVDKIEKKSKGN